MNRALAVLILLVAWPALAGNATYKHDEFMAEYLRKVAAQGDADAQYHLGTSYLIGRGVAPDITDAVWWWQKAAVQGHARAQLSLGLHQHRAGVRDIRTTVFWFCQAIHNATSLVGREEPLLLSLLGQIRAEGDGVAQDYVRAHMYFNLSATRDPRLGKWSRDLLAREMTTGQIEQARRLAREWTPNKPCP